jgi:hypothetical protein
LSVLGLLVAGCGAHGTAHVAAPIAAVPRVAMPSPQPSRRCAWQLAVVRNAVAIRGAKALNEIVDEVDRAIDEYAALEASAGTESAATCRQEIEATVEELGAVWIIEDHHHVGIPIAIRMLGTYVARMPSARNLDVALYFLGVGMQKVIGCCWGMDDPARHWREAADVFHRAAALGSRRMVPWIGDRVPLADAAARGEANARARAEALARP